MRQDIPNILRSLATELENEDYQGRQAYVLGRQGDTKKAVDASDAAREAHRRSLALREMLRRYNFVL